MYFLVDTDKKIIFGWSAKCGCSHVKTIYWFLKTGNLTHELHTINDINILPDDIEIYTTLIFIRNPYTRIVSGFLDKYRKDGKCRHLWTSYLPLTFSNFVDKLINYEWEFFDAFHFIPQTSEYFNKKILRSKIIKFYDISNIDYTYIEQLYNKKIPQSVLYKKYGHERSFQIKKDEFYDKYVYDLNIDEYSDYIVDIKYFYNEEIREKVYNFFKEDFIFFKENNIDYIQTNFSISKRIK